MQSGRSHLQQEELHEDGHEQARENEGRAEGPNEEDLPPSRWLSQVVTCRTVNLPQI
jgi:hypothetical protein